jgi:hypothetical protein
MNNDTLIQAVDPNLPDKLALCYDRLRQVVVPSPMQQQQQQQQSTVGSRPKTVLELCQMMDQALAEDYPEMAAERAAQEKEIEENDYYGLDV